MRESGWRRGLRAAWRPGRAPLVDADAVLGGRADAAALLGLRIVRTSSWLVAYRLALARAVPLALTLALWGLAVGALTLTFYLAPLSLLLVVAWSLVVPVVQLEEQAGVAALRRSWRLVRPQAVKVAALVGFGALLTALAGGLIGVLPLLVAQVPFLVVNLIPGVVAALLGPFTSLLVGYAYFHGVAAEERPAADAVAASR